MRMVRRETGRNWERGGGGKKGRKIESERSEFVWETMTSLS